MLSLLAKLVLNKLSSYPTYEEWKLKKEKEKEKEKEVLILPMRNGNINIVA